MLINYSYFHSFAKEIIKRTFCVLETLTSNSLFCNLVDGLIEWIMIHKILSCNLRFIHVDFSSLGLEKDLRKVPKVIIDSR